MSNLTERVTALETDVADIKTGVKAILGALQSRGQEQPQVLAAPVVTGTVVASSTEEPKKGKKGKKARKTVDRKPVKNGTIEGKRCLVRGNREQFIADHDWAQRGQSVTALVEAVKGGAQLVGNWAIGPKTAAKHGLAVTTPVVVAKASKSEPAKPKVQSFRRANGTVAPKAEWPIRAALEAQGLTRKEVDEKVEQALAILA